MSKEKEVYLTNTGLHNSVLLSTQKPEDGLTLNQLFHEIRSITAICGGNSRVHISVDPEDGMILTVSSERDGMFHSYALNPPRSSTTSE